MRFRAAPILLVAALSLSALSLSGCVSAREVPAPISDTELQTHLEDRVDAAWLNSGLDGTVERPESDPAGYLESYRDDPNQTGFSDCLQTHGVEGWGMTDVNGGPVFTGQTGEKLTSAEELFFYTCFAENPSDMGFGRALLSPAEQQYLYDYYQEWVVPCLELKGYTVSFIPSREDYVAGSGFGWMPYYALESGPSGKDPYGDGGEAMFALADQCGNPYPGMNYGAEYGFR